MFLLFSANRRLFRSLQTSVFSAVLCKPRLPRWSGGKVSASREEDPGITVMFVRSSHTIGPYNFHTIGSKVGTTVALLLAAGT